MRNESGELFGLRLYPLYRIRVMPRPGKHNQYRIPLFRFSTSIVLEPTIATFINSPPSKNPAQKIHGIHKEDVENKPEFNQLWHEIEPYLYDKIIIAHNASFDINVLRKTLLHYGIPKPKARYICTYQLSRIVWKESTKFSLDHLCNQENITLNHHKAESDAEACARLFLREAEILEANNFYELKQKTKLRLTRV